MAHFLHSTVNVENHICMDVCVDTALNLSLKEKLRTWLKSVCKIFISLFEASESLLKVCSQGEVLNMLLIKVFSNVVDIMISCWPSQSSSFVLHIVTCCILDLLFTQSRSLFLLSHLLYVSLSIDELGLKRVHVFDADIPTATVLRFLVSCY